MDFVTSQGWAFATSGYRLRRNTVATKEIPLGLEFNVIASHRPAVVFVRLVLDGRGSGLVVGEPFCSGHSL